jgi:RHS repeat-associated protein
LTDAWAYGLPDGSGTQRQLVDPAGEITLAASYTPWGDALSVSGEGNFTYGYFGGVMDTATGLLYVGNGQYYDPSTGRFLNRSVNPDSANPYVPWSGEPTGALIGPLVLLAMVYNRKKRREKIDVFIILFVLCLAIGMSLAACGPGTTPGEPSPTTEPQSTQSNQDNTAPTQPPVSGTPGGDTNKGSNPGNPGSGNNDPSADSTVECYVTPTPDTTPTSPPTPTPIREFVGNFNLSGYYTPIYEKQTWVGDNTLAETNPNNKSAIFYGPFLARGGGYTKDKRWALSASEGFLGYNGGICTQGTGIIEGRVILCSTSFPNPAKFTWGSFEDDLAHLQAYKTVARCGSSRFLGKNETIYVDAAWFNDILEKNNPKNELIVTDTGNYIPGLCNPPNGNEGIDLYFGEGQDAYLAWLAFQNKKAEAVAKTGTKYWPVYRILK